MGIFCAGLWSSDTWQWWLQYGFDGIGGGLIGGGAAWLLLRQTIKHERRLRAEERDAARLAEIRAQLAHLSGTVPAFVYASSKNDRAELARLVAVLKSQCLIVLGLSYSEPGLRERVEAYLAELDDQLTKVIGAQITTSDMSRSLQKFEQDFVRWIGDRESLQPAECIAGT